MKARLRATSSNRDRCRGIAMAFVVMLLASTAHGLGARFDTQFHFVPAGGRFADIAQIKPPSPPPRDEFVDAGDVIPLPGGKSFPLLRARNCIAVRFAPGISRESGLSRLQQRKDVPAHQAVDRAEFRGQGVLQLVRADKKGALLDPLAVQRDAGVAYARPVLADGKSKTRMIASDELLVRFADDFRPAQIRAAAALAGLQVVGKAHGRLGIHRLRMVDPQAGDPLQIARALAATPGVLWAQPNFIRELQRAFTPPNPLFATQQTLRNTGRNHAVAGADVDAAGAWDRTIGSNSVVIAIIDDGVDTAHPGLRFFTNSGESGNGKETNGVDDDGNGLLDDVHGWDFANGTNNPSPVGFNGHGTGTAGIAGGTFEAGAPSAGIAAGCTILPIKIADDSGTFTTDLAIAEAILYAAEHADVLSNSWGGGGESPAINAAIDYAVTFGRGGKGCPVFFATGNNASSWDNGGGRFRLSTAGINGNFHYSFFFQRGTNSAGENAVRIDNVCLLDADGYTHMEGALPSEDFEGFFFPPLSGWWSVAGGGASNFWGVSSSNALTGTGGNWSAVSPELEPDQYGWLITPLLPITGKETFAFAASFSLPDDSYLFIPLYDEAYNFFGYYGPFTDLPTPDPTTTYPASYSNSIAVGAATDCDRRSDYSQHEGHIDFVAPSNGGWNDVATLDPLGTVGWTTNDFKMGFGGTSAATPLAAGIAALMISLNPTLTAVEVRTLMRRTCDKIGGVAYDENGFHSEYGFGRVNARKAIASALPLLQMTNVTVWETPAGTTNEVALQVSLSGPTTRDVSVDFTTADGTAVSGLNYGATNGSLLFPAGSTSATVVVGIIGGSLTEPQAVFSLTLSQPTNAAGPANPTLVTTIALDSDHDGIPDFWEIRNGLDPADPADAALDGDGDGFTNLQEFLTGTDPREPTSFLSIAGILSSDSEMILTLNLTTGKRYGVDYRSSVTDTNWSPIVAEFLAVAPRQEITNAVPTSTNSSGFYRVRLLP